MQGVKTDWYRQQSSQRFGPGAEPPRVREEGPGGAWAPVPREEGAGEWAPGLREEEAGEWDPGLREEGARVLAILVLKWVIILKTLSTQVFEIRTTDDLTEAWLQEKLSFFR